MPVTVVVVCTPYDDCKMGVHRETFYTAAEYSNIPTHTKNFFTGSLGMESPTRGILKNSGGVGTGDDSYLFCNVPEHHDLVSADCSVLWYGSRSLLQATVADLSVEVTMVDLSVEVTMVDLSVEVTMVDLSVEVTMVDLSVEVTMVDLSVGHHGGSLC
ncbi:hypothetical protein BaRGS_00017094 [Batillaria attramentaria]|uniref:Uncharacterized protein n=1 Tax=Batillaria attramentaria TaxID=370345 RepID=A0ABD0KX59_9CAEN